MIDKKVYGIDGPGQAPRDGLAGNEGIIVGEKKDRWGEFWIVQWTSGHQEPFFKHTIKPAAEFRGIGVYLAP